MNTRSTASIVTAVISILLTSAVHAHTLQQPTVTLYDQFLHFLLGPHHLPALVMIGIGAIWLGTRFMLPRKEKKRSPK